MALSIIMTNFLAIVYPKKLLDCSVNWIWQTYANVLIQPVSLGFDSKMEQGRPHQS